MPSKTSRQHPTHTEHLAKLPPWTTDPLDRLEHTLAAHEQNSPKPKNEMALYATSTTHPEPGQPALTGVTWGDLEQLAAELRAARRSTGSTGAPDERSESMPDNSWRCRGCHTLNNPETETCDSCGGVDSQ